MTTPPELRTLPGLWNWYDTTPRQLAFNAQTRAEAEHWQDMLRATLIDLMGGFPAERCDLDPRVMERAEEPAFVREKVLLQTLPGDDMPCTLLWPRHTPPPYRAVIALHGHGKGGARLLIGNTDDPIERELIDTLNYDYARQLAERGFLVLVPELRGLGDRMEDPLLRDATHPAWHSSCHAAGLNAMLCGKTLIGLRVWDIMRLVDYLQTRPEPLAPGVTCAGLSTGGMVTLFTAALEPRITSAVVSGYFNTFRDSIMAIRHCSCNYIPGLLQYAEMVDIAGLIAPRPLFIESGNQDPLFPTQAAQRAYTQLQAIYRCFEAEANLAADWFEGGHEWHGTHAYDWLER